MLIKHRLHFHDHEKEKLNENWNIYDAMLSMQIKMNYYALAIHIPLHLIRSRNLMYGHEILA